MLEHYLRQQLYRFDCPTMDILRDYYWKHLPAGEQRRVEQHVKDCPHCEGELAELTRLMSLDNNAVSEPTPSLRERLQIVVAQLLTPQAGLLPALRGTAHETKLFDAGEGWLVSINTELAADDSRTLLGQLLSPAPLPLADARVRLRAAEPDARQHEAPLDTNGTFVLANLPAGEYQLRLTLADRQIVIPSFTI